MRVIDISDIANENMTEVGFFDTYPNNNNANYNGVWNVYPFFGSGHININDRSGGFFLVRSSSLDKGEGINGMVALEVDEDLLVERLLKRGETSGRSDDQDESKIRNRFNEYNTKTAVLKDYYQDQNKYFGVHGVGNIEEVTQRLCKVIDNL